MQIHQAQQVVEANVTYTDVIQRKYLGEISHDFSSFLVTQLRISSALFFSLSNFLLLGTKDSSLFDLKGISKVCNN